MPPLTKPDKPGEIPAHFKKLYDHMEAYFQANQRHATNRELVDAGFASSTSHLRYYYNQMADLGMMTVSPGVARGVFLRPRSEWESGDVSEPEPVHGEFKTFHYGPSPYIRKDTPHEHGKE